MLRREPESAIDGSSSSTDLLAWNDARANTMGNCGVTAKTSKVGSGSFRHPPAAWSELGRVGPRFPQPPLPANAMALPNVGGRLDCISTSSRKLDNETNRMTQRPHGPGEINLDIFVHSWRPSFQRPMPHHQQGSTMPSSTPSYHKATNCTSLVTREALLRTARHTELQKNRLSEEQYMWMTDGVDKRCARRGK